MLLTIPQAAEKLGISRQRVHVLVKTGRLKAKRFGRVWLIEPDAIHNIAPSENPTGRPRKR